MTDRRRGIGVRVLGFVLGLAVLVGVGGIVPAAWAQQTTPLTNGVPVSGTVPENNFADFSIVVPAGATQLTATLTNLSGDVDLYVKFGGLPEFLDNDCFSENFFSENEICTIPNPNAGTWFISALGFDPGTHSFTVTATFQTGPGGGGDASAFVTRLYQQVLNRQPDPAGLAAFVQQIADFGSVVPTTLAFFHSQEFLARNTLNPEFLTICYRTFLNREPDLQGFNAFLTELLAGRLTRDNILAIFIGSDEFADLTSFLPPLSPLEIFVTNLYVEILGRGPDQLGLQAFVDQLQQNCDLLGLIRAFLASPEFLMRNTSNTEFVTILYRVFLDRVPDAPGLTGFVTQLNQGAATRAQLVNQFAASAEFQAIEDQICGSGPPPPPPPGQNQPPTLSHITATRIVHSFGREESFRSEGVAGRPGFAALAPLTAPKVITLDADNDGLPDTPASPLVLAAAGLPSCCTLLIAEGASDPDGNPIVFHWQLNQGTFYSTGSIDSGGFAFGARITNLSVYNRNSVFFEVPSINFPVQDHPLAGGQTSPSAFVTDIPSSGSPLQSPTRFRTLDYDQTIHVEVTFVGSRSISPSDPNFPGGVEMDFFADISGNSFEPLLSVTFRVDCGSADRTFRFFDFPGAGGASFTCRYKFNEIGSTVRVVVVPSTPATAVGGSPFVVPISSNIAELDFHRSKGCTLGDTLFEKVEVKTGPQSIEVLDSGSSADDAFDLIVNNDNRGTTPAGGNRIFQVSLGSGTHNLCIVYVDCTFCDGAGTYRVTLNGGMTFSPGGTIADLTPTERSGTLSPFGTQPVPPFDMDCFPFVVP
jgi:hypothetical protein